MNHPDRTLVLATVARHLEVDHDAVTMDQDLEGDLGLDFLDLVLIASRLEGLSGADLPVQGLREARTVGDLASLLRRALALRDLDAAARDARPGRRLRGGGAPARRLRRGSSLGLRLAAAARV